MAEPFELFAAEDRPVRTVTLVRLAGEIHRALTGLGRLAVQGEVHNPKVRPNGRVYFTLKDRAATIAVTCPSRAARRSRVVDGERVTVTGSVQWVPEWGRAELLAEEVVPVGAGAQAALVARAREALRADGLLDRRRRRLPLLPRRIGVVCGAEAAVRRDIESVIADRYTGYPVRFCETTVSGPGAAGAIQAAVQRLCDDPDVDIVLLARGGGDATQLLPWSDEELCRTVAAAPLPVVSAIGHEDDRPLCDEVADARFGTPSIAAAALVPSRRDLEAMVDATFEQVSLGVSRRVDVSVQRFDRVDARRSLDAALAGAAERWRRTGEGLAAVSPDRSLERAAARLAAVDWGGPLVRRAERGDDRLAALEDQIHALSPAGVLDRGYAVVRSADGAVVRSAESVTLAEAVSVQVARGRFRAVVDEVQP